MYIEELWGCADYSPTARRLVPAAATVVEALRAVPPGSSVLDIGAGHGHLTTLLVDAGFEVTALEPAPRMAEVGARRCPQARWVRGLGEDTGLPDAGFDAIASNFGAFLCGPGAGDEWARILRPGGRLALTAWDRRGFLAEMTLLMQQAVDPSSPVSQPPHMHWGDDGVAEHRLGAGFVEVAVRQVDLPWCFPTVEEGMQLYLEGSPGHTFALQMAGPRREDLEGALRRQLRGHARADGRIESFAGYVAVTATRRLVDDRTAWA